MESHPVGTGNWWVCRTWVSGITSCSCFSKSPPAAGPLTHLKPLSDTLGDADGELGYLGSTRFSFLAVRFIFSLSFHNNLSQETERYMVSSKPDSQMCSDTSALSRWVWDCQVQRYPPFLQAVRTASAENSPRRRFPETLPVHGPLAAPGEIQNWGPEK